MELAVRTDEFDGLETALDRLVPFLDRQKRLEPYAEELRQWTGHLLDARKEVLYPSLLHHLGQP